ncbi:MAG TPA: alpha/beta hydrolase [Steroidobacteraceae bacterium]|nr:alpha/beta hydrolase [Steroidobacteraceae bacterium]
MKTSPLSLNRRQLILAGSMAVLTTNASAAADPGGDTIDVWPAGAPGAERVTVREEVVERLPDGPMRDRFVQHVTRPTLTLFKPKTAWNGVTLLIVPGGGYVRVVIDKEGFECAEWFTERGFAAAVLRYRMPADGWAAGPDAPVHDAMRALRVLRSRQVPTGTRAGRTGIMGFSAGGHLSARLITEPSLRYAKQDSADELPARPDFAVLMYPVIATTGATAHAGSAAQLRKAGVVDSGLARYAPHGNVSAVTPPTMLVHAGDDTSVPVENSLLMYQALQKARVRSELHVFDSGGHGFGLRGVAGRNVAVWPELVQHWALSDDSTKA